MSRKKFLYYFYVAKGYLNSIVNRFLSDRVIFRRLYFSRKRQLNETVSGPGSTTEQTAGVVKIVSSVIAQYGIKRVLDIPCGDFNWMRHVPMENVFYFGADIVPEVVENNINKYGREQRLFKTLDIRKDPLPEADLIICRDCLVHFSIRSIYLALGNIRKSGATYFLTTTFPGHRNRDIATGDWFMLNLQAAPFNLPAPLQLFNEGYHDKGSETGKKSLGLWMIKDLP